MLPLAERVFFTKSSLNFKIHHCKIEASVWNSTCSSSCCILYRLSTSHENEAQIKAAYTLTKSYKKLKSKQHAMHNRNGVLIEYNNPT